MRTLGVNRTGHRIGPYGLRKGRGQNGREEKSGRGKGGRKEERAKLAETSRTARPSRGHPASWQRLPVTSRQGRGDGEAGGRGACKTLESLFI